MKQIGNRKGFTLIELLVVIAIIAILAAIAIPQYAKYRERAQDSAALSDLKTVQTSAEAYYADHMSYVSGDGTTVYDSGNPLTMGNDNVSFSANVKAKYWSDNSTYAADTYNTKGTGREFGIASTDSKVHYKDGVSGNPDDITGTSTVTSWSTLP